ncbi:MAG: hypothetical protein OEV36_12565 [Myxococcales bacterium]|nr:hypothetical protein [Myxococcales bacterium]
MLRPIEKRPERDVEGLPDALERVRHTRQQQLVLTPHAAAADLAHWLASEGLDGWLTAAEIDAAWEARRAKRNAAWISNAVVLEALRSVPGVRYIERTRLGDPQFAEIRTRFRAMKKRHDRAALYWIPPLDDDKQAPG